MSAFHQVHSTQVRLKRCSRRCKDKHGGDIQVAQRNKRRPTIIDKLSREPSMQLPTMHDIAGCRAICSSVEELYSFRKTFLNTRALHKRNTLDDKFDYIKNPKSSGYRGVHEVFETVLQSNSGSKWNGLKVEIQFRTRAQHAWATAVETIDLLNNERAKFGQADPKLQRFFAVSSELISRCIENTPGPLKELSNSGLALEFEQLNEALGIITAL